MERERGLYSRRKGAGEKEWGRRKKPRRKKGRR